MAKHVLLVDDELKKKILIVDDDIKDLDAMKQILQRADYDVVTSTDGAEALDIIADNGFDLILVDIRMPTLSGYDLSRLLRERMRHPLKIAYISILPEREVSLETVDGFIQKPFSPESLLDAVRGILGEKEG